MPVYLLPDTDTSLIIGFDLVESEGHSFTSEVTEHPVEQGSNLVDHIRQNPQQLTLKVAMTNTPIEDLGRGSIEVLELTIPQYHPPLLPTPGSLFNAAQSGITNLITGGAKPLRIQTLTFPEPFDRIKEVYNQLLELWTVSATMSVVTSLRTYEAMAFEDVSLPREEKGKASITLQFKQIRTVTTASVSAPKPAEKRGMPKQAKGSQSTKPTENPVKATSILIKGLTSLGIVQL